MREEHLHRVTSPSEEMFGIHYMALHRGVQVEAMSFTKKKWGADSLLLESIDSVPLSWICLLKSDKSHVPLCHVPSSFADSAKHMLAPSLCFSATGY